MYTHSPQLIRATGSIAAFAVLVMAAVAGAQSTPASQADELKQHLIEMSALQKESSTAIDALITRAGVVENANNFRAAADDLALAAMVSTDFSQRDTLRLRLRTVVQKEMGTDTTKGAQVDSEVARTLDRAFQEAFDRGVRVSKVESASSGRTVVAEYITGIQCSACWLHDRLYAALLQRYPSSDVVVLAYHDGPGYPIAHTDDQLWGYIASAAYGIQGLYRIQTALAAGDIGWIDGKPVIDNNVLRANSARLTGLYREMYARVTPVVDKRMRQPPGADVALTVTPGGASDTGLASVGVEVRVKPKQRGGRLGVRLALVEDTVRVTGFTNRRLQYAAVRTVAWFGHHHRADDLFFPVPAAGTSSTKVVYTFDVAELQRSLLATHDSVEEARNAFPDPQTWRIHPRRLGVVAIVQDRDTKEVLQTAYQRVFPASP